MSSVLPFDSRDMVLRHDVAEPSAVANATCAGDDIATADHLREMDVARWLAEHPDFLDRHPQVLETMSLRHTAGGGTVSLIERQVQVLRQQAEQLQTRLSDLMQLGERNDVLQRRMKQLTHALLGVADARAIPGLLVDRLGTLFEVPHVALRLWSQQSLRFVAGTADATAASIPRALARAVQGLSEPYCGPFDGHWANCAASDPRSVCRWLPDGGAAVRSMAIIALNVMPVEFDATNATIDVAPMSLVPGVLVLACEDVTRFQAGMGTQFLGSLGELAGAALARGLRDSDEAMQARGRRLEDEADEDSGTAGAG